MTVPTAPDVAAALARLRPGRGPLAALHLALPVSDAVGLTARTVPGQWSWRGASVASCDPAGACLLAAMGWAEGDRFLDLSGDPLTWVKPVRSGYYTLTYGSDLLHDLPLLLLSPAAAPAWADALAATAAGDLAPGQTWRGHQVTAMPLGWAVGD